MEENIIEFLKIQYNGADEKLKQQIRTILNESIVVRCKCPQCGEKFDPSEHVKYSKKLL